MALQGRSSGCGRTRPRSRRCSGSSPPPRPPSWLVVLRTERRGNVDGCCFVEDEMGVFVVACAKYKTDYNQAYRTIITVTLDRRGQQREASLSHGPGRRRRFVGASSSPGQPKACAASPPHCQPRPLSFLPPSPSAQALPLSLPPRLLAWDRGGGGRVCD